MVYVHPRLNGKSQNHLQSWLKDGALTFASMADMLKILEILFDKLNRARDPAARLHFNYQRNRPLLAVLPRSDGMQRWPDMNRSHWHFE